MIVYLFRRLLGRCPRCGGTWGPWLLASITKGRVSSRHDEVRTCDGCGQVERRHVAVATDHTAEGARWWG